MPPPLDLPVEEDGEEEGQDVLADDGIDGEQRIVREGLREGPGGPQELLVIPQAHEGRRGEPVPGTQGKDQPVDEGVQDEDPEE